MRNTLLLLLFLLSWTLISTAQQVEQSHHSNASGRHAPIGVMGDHTHNQSEWMFSYRFMNMNMEELKRGGDDASFSSALADYMVTPTRMQMQMHMLGLMYAPSNQITLMVMANYSTMEMEHITRMGGEFTTNSSSMGDLKIGTLYRLVNRPNSKLHAEASVFIPIGSIDEQDVIPASAPNSVILPYPMQIGSGTWDPTLALTYLREIGKFNFGVQGRALLRIDENNNNYRLGNQYEMNGWASYNLSSWISFSGRLKTVNIAQIEGSNPSLNPNMVITADTNNSGGEFLYGAVGLNVLMPAHVMKGLRFAVEFSNPLNQDLNGIQLRTNESYILGIQYSIN